MMKKQMNLPEKSQDCSRVEVPAGELIQEHPLLPADEIQQLGGEVVPSVMLNTITAGQFYL